MPTRSRVSRFSLYLPLLLLPLLALWGAGCEGPAEADAPSSVDPEFETGNLMTRTSALRLLQDLSETPVGLTWDPAASTARQFEGTFRPGQDATDRAGQAREFLRRIQKVLRASAEEGDLQILHDRASLTGEHVWFQQTYQGLPVLDKVTAVHFADDEGGSLLNQVLNRLEPDLAANLDFALDEAGALAAAREAIGVVGDLRVPAETKRVIAQDSDGTFKGFYQVQLAANDPLGDWEALVDGTSGTVGAIHDHLRNANGKGYVFLSNAMVATGDTSLSDNGDAASAVPESAYTDVTIEGLDSSGYLKGSYVDVDGGSGQRAYSSALEFYYNRQDDRFEQVMAYYHIDRVQRYIQSLGFTNVNKRAIRVHANATTEQNAWYSPYGKDITLGTGGVDLGEDGEVIVHEYGHATQDDMIPGFGGGEESGALGEGFSDFLQAMAFEDVGPDWHNLCVAEWASSAMTYSNPPCLRRLDSTKRYPNDWHGEVHDDGEIWAAPLYEMYEALGKDLAMQLAIESHFYLGRNPSFPDAANAILEADRRLYDGQHVNTIQQIFADRGILEPPAGVDPSPVEEEGWMTEAIRIDSPHDYQNNLSRSWTASHAGASQIRVHFSVFDTETNYDYVIIEDGSGREVASYHGQKGAFTSAAVDGDRLVVRLRTDESVTRYGFTIDRIEYQGGTPDPVCGNGIVEEGEGCDDDNVQSGDGCSATCQVEAAAPPSSCLIEEYATETKAFSVSLARGPVTISLDWDNPSQDLDLYLYDTAGRELASSLSVTPGEQINASIATAGPYYVYVYPYNGGGSLFCLNVLQ